jgi:putative peptidoglycan lipid II flippase
MTGFLRDLVIARFFGTMVAADAYAAAIKIPNVLRNLLGEGSLSAAFVPVYSSLLEGDRAEGEEPALLARRVLGRLVLLAGVLSALGVALAPWLTRIVAPGFDAEASTLTTQLVRILFPMAGVMILAAWCLGVLTSHRRFFLPFAAPVLWNLAQVAGLLLGARYGWSPLIQVLAWSTLAGSLLQLSVQLPTARRLARGIRPARSARHAQYGAGRREPGDLPGRQLCRRDSRELPARRGGGRPVLRPAPGVSAAEPLRRLRRRGGASGNVPADGTGSTCAPGS